MLDNGKAEGVRKIKRFEKYCLKDIATVSQGFTFSRLYQGKKNLKWNYFKVADIGLNPNSKYLTNAINTISDITMEEIGVLPFPKGSIVFPRVGAALFNNNKKILAQDGMVDDNVLVLTVTDTSKCWHEFLYYYLQGIPLAKWCNSGLVPVINTKTVLSQMVFLPPLPEQQKIATILSTQDKVIELKEKLLVQKQQQKKYLMQQLLTGKKRLPGFGGEWKTIHFNEISCRIETKNTVGNNNVLTISAQYGLINQTEFFDKVIASDNKSNYYLLSKDEFAYNRSYSKGYPYGTIKRLKRYVQGVVSPLYICFAVNKKLASLDFLEQYFEASIINREIQSIVQEGARNHGMLNVAVDDFFRIKITMPEIEEQKEIAKILSTADHEIDLLQKSIEAEKQKKKALMQLLLTGKVRVKI